MSMPTRASITNAVHVEGYIPALLFNPNYTRSVGYWICTGCEISFRAGGERHTSGCSIENNSSLCNNSKLVYVLGPNESGDFSPWITQGTVKQLQKTAKRLNLIAGAVMSPGYTNPLAYDPAHTRSTGYWACKECKTSWDSTRTHTSDCRVEKDLFSCENKQFVYIFEPNENGDFSPWITKETIQHIANATMAEDEQTL